MTELINNTINNERGEKSIVYQITQCCPFSCPICNRRFLKFEKQMTSKDRKKMAMVLINSYVKRITITGGEPLLLGDELFDYLSFLHENKIHTCLSTTGIFLDQKDIVNMDNYLDHLMISMRSTFEQNWSLEFGEDKYVSILPKKIISILNWIKNTNIITEVSTVIHKNNYNNIIAIGEVLQDINSNIIWRIEDYYAMGKEYQFKNRFELDEQDSYIIKQKISKHFRNTFKNIYFSEKNRFCAQDLFITPSGALVKTSNNEYSEPIGNICSMNILPVYNMRRKWNEYQIYCREWI